MFFSGCRALYIMHPHARHWIGEEADGERRAVRGGAVLPSGGEEGQQDAREYLVRFLVFPVFGAKTVGRPPDGADVAGVAGAGHLVGWEATTPPTRRPFVAASLFGDWTG
jgi:hypothetical protein